MHCATLLFNLREVFMCFLERIKHVSQRILLIILLEKCFTPVQGLQNRFAGETGPQFRRFHRNLVKPFRFKIEIANFMNRNRLIYDFKI
jgi:hypothetical protein